MFRRHLRQRQGALRQYLTLNNQYNKQTALAINISYTILAANVSHVVGPNCDQNIYIKYDLLKPVKEQHYDVFIIYGLKCKYIRCSFTKYHTTNKCTN